MVSLIELSPCAGLLPLSIGSVTLTEGAAEPMFLIAPFRGRADEVGKLLESAFGLGFPPPGRWENSKGARILWAGRGRALLVGAPPPGGVQGLAAVTDQSDASAVVRIEGRDAAAVLARLVPLDLREPAFGAGATARSLVNHMPAQITRIGDEAFEIMVFRSMAGTLAGELAEAARGVAARANAGNFQKFPARVL